MPNTAKPNESTPAGKPMWVAKYALNKGVYPEDMTEATTEGDKVRTFKPVDHNFWSLYKLGLEVFFTEAEALEQAELNRKKRISSLRKQIRKAQDFNVGYRQEAAGELGAS
jgi:hypothetical protein